jgi:stearoyl-CoA desaturase (delta-9 desaturase)
VNIKATESLLTTLTAWGEGGHNYVRACLPKLHLIPPTIQHHTFPQDYRTSEMMGVFNFSRVFIEFFAKIGWAYDLKTMDEQSIQRQMNRQLEKILKAEQQANAQGRKAG